MKKRRWLLAGLVALIAGASATAYFGTAGTRTRRQLEQDLKGSTFVFTPRMATLAARCNHTTGYLWYCEVDVDQGGAEGLATTTWVVRKYAHCWTAARDVDFAPGAVPTDRTLKAMETRRGTCR